jgi:hypothetical protein
MPFARPSLEPGVTLMQLTVTSIPPDADHEPLSANPLGGR